MRYAMVMVMVLGLVTTGCDRVIQLDVEQGPTRLVIEGRVERTDGAAAMPRVRLSLTDALTAPGNPPPALGAMVVVSDGQHEYPAVASSTEPGTYLIPELPLPSPGTVYTLTIDWQGDRYQAIDTMNAVVPIDSLYFEWKDRSIAGDPGLRSALDYTDPAAPGNYYLWELLVNDSLRMRADFGNRMRMISDDRLYNGLPVMGYRPFDEEIVFPGERVTLRQVALSEQAYRYYGAVLDQSNGNDGSPFAVPPASVRGNVVNLTSPARYPLGYFLAVGVSERTATVPSTGQPH